MKFTITQRIACGLTIPDGKSLRIDECTFLPDFEGETQARHIQAIIEANTQEEATDKAQRLFNDFLAKLTILDNSKYTLVDQLLISDNSPMTVHTTTISVSGFIVKDSNETKRNYETLLKNKRLRKSQ